jgi:transposase
MQALTVDTPTVTHCGTIFVAIELSQKTWLLTVHSPDRDRMSRHKLEGGEYAELQAPIARTRGPGHGEARLDAGGGELL